MKVVQISDCHLYADEARRGYNDINPYLSLEKVLCKAVCEEPDLVLFTGDISGDASSQSYQHFAFLCEQYLPSVQWWYIPGNHDCPKTMLSMFEQHSLSQVSPLKFGKWWIHGLNSYYKKTLGYVSPASLDELEATTLGADECFHLAAVHHHPILTGSWMDKHEWLNRGEFLTMLVRLQPLRGVIYGHIHTDSQHEIANTRLFSCPSSCWQWTMQPEFGFSDEQPGFRVLTLCDDGQIETQVIRV